jgi:hypothetical protein
MRKLSAEEIRAVLACDGPTRYSHFIKQAADSNTVWGLREADGWVSLSDDSEVPMFPVWPHADYAHLLATGSWASATPTAIDLDEWLDTWLPNLIEQGDKVAVFQTPTGKGLPVDPAQLRDDLEAELSRYE